jgi:MFS transporter, DHA2 family, glioxin efflux transporter
MEPNSATTEKPQTADTFTPNTDVESAENGDKKAGNTHEKATSIDESEPVPDEYPYGFRLALLVGAIMMTVFLTSLDQVSDATGTP